jgi:hypothetical protein
MFICWGELLVALGCMVSSLIKNTIKSVYKGHLGVPEYVPFI